MATELFTAIRAGDGSAVERLLEQDPSVVESRDENGLSPILAALYHGRREIAAAILRRRPTLTVFEAAAAGELGRVRELVAREASLANATSPDGFSPLGLAAFFKHREVVRYLLDAGADPRPASRDQRFTPLHSAVATDVGAGDVNLVHMLLDGGADPNAQSLQGGTALHTAAFTGDLAIAALLLDHGADPSVKTNDGKTPGDVALERGHPAVADLLRSRSHAPSVSEVY
jgi:ankyrin repeat protein